MKVFRLVLLLISILYFVSAQTIPTTKKALRKTLQQTQPKPLTQKSKPLPPPIGAEKSLFIIMRERKQQRKKRLEEEFGKRHEKFGK